MNKPRPAAKINKTMERSYQKGGKIGEGTALASGAKQATITFTPDQYDWLAERARAKGISLSEQVRCCVSLSEQVRRCVRQFQD